QRNMGDVALQRWMSAKQWNQRVVHRVSHRVGVILSRNTAGINRGDRLAFEAGRTTLPLFDDQPRRSMWTTHAQHSTTPTSRRSGSPVGSTRPIVACPRTKSSTGSAS